MLKHQIYGYSLLLKSKVIIPFKDHSLVGAKGLAQLNEATSHAVQGYPRPTDHSEEFWQNVLHWRRKRQPTPVFLPGEPHGQYEKAKGYDAGRWVPQVEWCPVCSWDNAVTIFRVPWTARRSNQSTLKGINSQNSLEGMMLKLKLQHFVHLMQRADSLEEILILGKTEGKRSSRGWDP